MKKGKQTKPHASPMPVATAAHKEALLKHLAAGIGPGEAAEAIGVGRSTVFYWKKNDAELAMKWEEAVETSLDKLETVSYNLALGGDPRMIEWNLKWRRKDVYQNTNEDRAIYFLNVPLQEHYETLERLGLPAPVIEPDYARNCALDCSRVAARTPPKSQSV
jgi:hypothetical protein